MSTDVKTIIGPEHHGRTMTLAEFEHAEAPEGRIYELGRGVIVVSDVPHPRHFRVVHAIKDQLNAYETKPPDALRYLVSIGHCKLLVEELQSERRPDLTVYNTEPPQEDSSVWSVWIPELVIEVVAPNSRSRDYGEKPEEYLRFGVREYWIVDPDERRVVAMQRWRGEWRRREVVPPATYASAVLPGFELKTEPVFASADPN